MALQKTQDVESPFVDDVAPFSPKSESHNVAVVDGEVQGPFKKRTSTPNSPPVRTRDSNQDGGEAVGPTPFTDAPLKRAG